MAASQKSKETKIAEQDSLLMATAQNLIESEITHQDSLSEITHQDSLILLAQTSDEPSDTSLAIVPVADVDQLTQSGAEEAVPVSWAPNNTPEVGLSSVKKSMPKEILTEDFLKEELKTKKISEVARKANVQHSSVVKYAKKHGIDLEKSYSRNRKNSTAGGNASSLKGKSVEKESVDTAHGMMKGKSIFEKGESSETKLPKVVKVTFIKDTQMEKAPVKKVLMEVNALTVENVKEEYLNLFPDVDLLQYHLVYQDNDADWVVLRTPTELALALEDIGGGKVIFSVQPK